VCHDAINKLACFTSAPVNEMPHSGSLQIRGLEWAQEMGRQRGV